MADYCIDGDAATNGTGSDASPFNTTVGMPLGAHTYRLRRGSTLRETFTFGAGTNSAKLLDYGDAWAPRASIDCENTRTRGVDLNSKVGCLVADIRIVNQNAGPIDGCVRVTGSGHEVRNVQTANARVGVHINNSPGANVHQCDLDVGNPLTPGEAYGIRVTNCVSGEAPRLAFNRLHSTAVGMTYLSGIMFYACSLGLAAFNDSYLLPKSDHLCLRQGATGITLLGNLLVGNGDLLSIEGSSSNIIRFNTAVHLGQAEDHLGPCLKLGDQFGAGAAADLNDIRNNVFWSRGVNRVIIMNPAGASNIIDHNLIWAPEAAAADDLMLCKIGAGAASILTYEQFQALGYQASGRYEDPMLDSGYRPLAGSPLHRAGVQLGALRRDLLGVQDTYPPTIGAFSTPTYRRSSY